MKRHAIHPLLLAAATLLAACGPAEPTDPTDPNQMQTSTQTAVDTEAPYLINRTPALGAKGVRTDAPITLVFSEPMDTDSVIAAFESDDIPAEQLVFSFNEAKDTLTIALAPGQTAVKYATGESLLVQTNAYSLFIGTGAKDLAGNMLEDGIEVSFETARQLWLDIPRLNLLSGSVTDDGQVIGGFAAGDTNSHLGVRALVTFSLENLQSVDVLEVQQADLTTSLGYIGGNPFALGMLVMEHVSFTDAATAYGIGAFGTPWVVSTAFELNTIVIDVKPALAADISAGAARNHRNQYRFGFEQSTNGDNVLDAVELGDPQLNLRAMLLVR